MEKANLTKITWDRFNLKMHVNLYNSFEQIKTEMPNMYKALVDLDLLEKLEGTLRKNKVIREQGDRVASPRGERREITREVNKQSITYFQLITKARSVANVEEFKEKHEPYYEVAKQTNALVDCAKAYSD